MMTNNRWPILQYRLLFTDMTVFAQGRKKQRVFILRESHAKNAFVSIIDGNKRTAYDTKKKHTTTSIKI